MNKWLLPFCFSLFLIALDGERIRRIGKLESQTWDQHIFLGQNQGSYLPSKDFPDLGTVGVLRSDSGFLGTATLIAPDLIVTAAHVVKNSLSDPNPEDENWQFILSSDFEQATIAESFEVSDFVIHPAWTIRQNEGINNGNGDGDRIGVDLCLAFLKEKVLEIYPMPLPNGNFASIGEQVIIAGYGTRVDGLNGVIHSNNSNRLAGENILDRVVDQISIPSLSDQYWGGVLAVDFDSPQQNTNFLGEEYPSIDYLGTGTSDANPLPLEVSTAVGDSGGPVLTNFEGRWRINGVVSYGTNYSLYGDITVFTRLASHQEWINQYLPAWNEAKILQGGSWMELKWFGAFLPFDQGWNFHSQLGWFFTADPKGSSFWSWHPTIGWSWVYAGVFPFLYSDERKNWFYLDRQSSNPERWLIYDYSIASWEIIAKVL